jgi:hypothetical protein
MNEQASIPEKRIEVVLAEATVLDPAKKYLIVLDGSAVSKADAQALNLALEAMGIDHAVAIIVDGDPATSVQIVET